MGVWQIGYKKFQEIGIMKAMDTASPRENIHPHFAQDFLLKLKSQTSRIISAMRTLLANGTIEDEVDRILIEEAVTFIEKPTEDYLDIQGHTTNIGQVLGGYEMQGVDLPQEIDEIHRYLLGLQCVNRIKCIEEELEKDSPDASKMQNAMVQLLDLITILTRGYKDDTLLNAIEQLERARQNV